ncbi:MAG TPA: glycosyltransferase [Gemmatimonadaceae bacterium]|jgi:glycosyltransferase involved in cell wall biosynthesis|nr:glycosyltransferase [Gemmatimonadaceae bacterium]
MSELPLVSVIIPAFNVAPFLEDAVVSALGQTHRNMEVIVVNDGSSDGTDRVANALAAHDERVRVIHQTNRGGAAARNAGLHVARGDYISHLDADDVLLPEKTARQLAYFAEHPECDLVYSDYIHATEQLEPLRTVISGEPPRSFREIIYYRNWFSVVVPLLRASLSRAVGDFDEGLVGVEDWDYWIRCAMVGVFGYLPGPVALYRHHGGQVSRQEARMRRSHEQIIEKHHGTNPRRRRYAIGARHWHYARHWYGRKYPLRTARELLAFAASVRDPREIRRIMQLG